MSYNVDDMIGKRFGSLTVIKLTDERQHRAKVWLCKCDCGNECKVMTTLLTRGRKTRCSQCCSDNFKKKDLIGKKFNDLYVLSVAPKDQWKYNMRSWTCICDCGNECVVPTAFLINGHKKSCSRSCGAKIRWRA